MKKLKIRRILVPTDFSKTAHLAIEHATFMARLFKADLYLLHSIEIPEPAYNMYSPVMFIRDIKEITESAKKSLDDLAAKLKKEKALTVKTVCLTGSPVTNIVTAVNDLGIDLVIMGTHGAHGFNEFFVGSNAHKTVTVCPCPVITIQTKSTKIGFTDIVLPIDDEFYSRQKVDHAISVAKAYGAKIHVLGLIDKNEDTDPKKFSVKIASVETALKKAGVMCDTTVIKDGNLAIAALRYSRKVKGDLIVVLSDHESNMSGAFLNAFAKQIVNHSKIPVMTIRQMEGDYDSIPLLGSSSI